MDKTYFKQQGRSTPLFYHKNGDILRLSIAILLLSFCALLITGLIVLFFFNFWASIQAVPFVGVFSLILGWVSKGCIERGHPNCNELLVYPDYIKCRKTDKEKKGYATLESKDVQYITAEPTYVKDVYNITIKTISKTFSYKKVNLPQFQSALQKTNLRLSVNVENLPPAPERNNGGSSGG